MLHMTDTVNKLTLVIQEVKTADKKSVDVIFGTVLLKPEDKKSKTGETINVHTLLGQVPAFEKHINRIIKEALTLHKESKEKKK